MRQYRFRPSTGKLACVFVLLLLFRVPVASATCGDGVLDEHFELCDHGAAVEKTAQAAQRRKTSGIGRYVNQPQRERS
jgi:hypothetical protein